MKEIRPGNEVVKGPRFGIRHIQFILLFLNATCIYISRTNISVAVVAMTHASTTNPDFPQFDWTEKEKNYIQSSFYWGYIILQFPAAFLSRRFGAKNILLVSTFISGISSLMIPYLITIGSWQAYCAIRAVQGLSQGAIFPSLNDHIAKWAPRDERFLSSAFIYSGANCGNVSAMLCSGLIAGSSLGWPGISYISGGLCLAWCVLWLIFGSINPPASRFITKEECQYIEASLNREKDFHKRRIPVPWFAMLTSTPLWVTILTSWAEEWGVFTLQSQIPTYMNGVLHMNIISNSFYSSMPYVASWIMFYIYMFMGSVILRRRWLGITAMRKVVNTIGAWIPAIVLIIIGFLDDTNEALIISLFVVGVAFESGVLIGNGLSMIDLSPNHASVVMGITNSLGNITPFVTPLFAGFVVTDVHDRSEWQVLFGISALTSFFGSLLFISFGASEPQPWDAPDFLEKKNIQT